MTCKEPGDRLMAVITTEVKVGALVTSGARVSRLITSLRPRTYLSVYRARTI